MNHLRCRTCGQTYNPNEPVWRCTCGGLLDLHFQAEFPLDRIQARPPDLWRYREALPLESDDHIIIIALGEGFTPLLPVWIGDKSIWIKQEHLFPTGSYKDRGAAMLISKSAELGISRVVEDSSGNAGCAVAAYCARAGMECDIYVPADTSAAKLAQIQMYGATLHKIAGSREDTARAVLMAAEQYYYASHSWNPFFFHGTKTFAYEVCEQLGWTAPDTIILPVGNGTLLLGVDIGMSELRNAGIIPQKPKLIAVQAAHCSPLAQRFFKPDSEITSPQPTIAEGIAIAEPIRGEQILDAVRNSGGTFITVSEDEIKTALIQMGTQGFYIEPTAAATIAGIQRYLATAPPDEVIVSVFTGHGLKATEKILKFL
ncbi:MAG: pyridoxal-phosphate dependent enzyme [Gemmatimonadetes bacterium]|nr:MAG: pyridoxal-phosphate dependent enzyme [Gemmatimonadota bacterium]